eukprot:scaffold6533_cov117-Isochrysis_galbana.AAC.1
MATSSKGVIDNSHATELSQARPPTSGLSGGLSRRCAECPLRRRLRRACPSGAALPRRPRRPSRPRRRRPARWAGRMAARWAEGMARWR